MLEQCHTAAARAPSADTKENLGFWSRLFSYWASSAVQTTSWLRSAARSGSWQQRGWCRCEVKLLSVGGTPQQGKHALTEAMAASQLSCFWPPAPTT